MIAKKWRVLPAEQKTPYLQQARENRTNQKMKKGHQVSFDKLSWFALYCSQVFPIVPDFLLSFSPFPSLSHVPRFKKKNGSFPELYYLFVI